MQINFGITPLENLQALVQGQNPALVIADVEFGDATVVEAGVRNTSVEVSGTAEGVYAGQAPKAVTYTRRDIAGADITNEGVTSVELTRDLIGNDAGIVAAVLAAVLVNPAAEGYLEALYDSEAGSVVIAPTTDAGLCLIGAAEIDVTFEAEVEPEPELNADLGETELDGFNA